MDWQLAQINIAKLKAPLHSPLLVDFVAQLDVVNKAAEQADGFVWRLVGDGGNATAYRHFGPDFIINMSVWRDVSSLRAYMMSPLHRAVMVQRSKWFEPMDSPHAALWWVKEGQFPDLQTADEKLQQLAEYGPQPSAFTFAASFAPPA